MSTKVYHLDNYLIDDFENFKVDGMTHDIDADKLKTHPKVKEMTLDEFAFAFNYNQLDCNGLIAFISDDEEQIFEANISDFHNISVFDDYNNGTLKYSILAYTIEHDLHNKIWELSIISTSMSELDGSEEGVLGEYTYFKKDEAEQDIEALRTLFNIQIDNI